MITALATVQHVDVIDGKYNVAISCEQQTSCRHCSSQQTCGTGIISKAVGNKSHQWQLETSMEVSVGQTVEVGLPEKQLIQFASIVYIVPLLLLFIGAMIGQWLATQIGSGEGVVIAISVMFMFAGVWLAKWLAKKQQSQSEQSVTLIRVMGDVIKITPN
ncbi:sigma-E factor regulatory protein RseC [Vibrio sp. MACH09]|uniref:SoxR reducing system RseC family protein n=1 Tax=unclassified Vibrio TaxID=2614977 RepID=UPI001493C42E|nr:MULTISPECIES: SoxR reducing system RseC family protein [unclassified Vibrio]NOI68386.1 transcriptional regulator [Vibrio sp. 99-8-1]GLO59904.1 sigma-E factor regulatory protein RseC [Vibrio sp. MACH09]